MQIAIQLSSESRSFSHEKRRSEKLPPETSNASRKMWTCHILRSPNEHFKGGSHGCASKREECQIVNWLLFGHFPTCRSRDRTILWPFWEFSWIYGKLSVVQTRCLFFFCIFGNCRFSAAYNEHVFSYIIIILLRSTTRRTMCQCLRARISTYNYFGRAGDLEELASFKLE